METITEGIVTAKSVRASPGTAAADLVSPDSVVSHVTRLTIAEDAGPVSESDGQNDAPGSDTEPSGAAVRGLKVPIVTITSDTADDDDGETLVQTAVLTLPAGQGRNGPPSTVDSDGGGRPPAGAEEDSAPTAEAVTAVRSAVAGAVSAAPGATAGGSTAAAVSVAADTGSRHTSPPASPAAAPPSDCTISTSTAAVSTSAGASASTSSNISVSAVTKTDTGPASVSGAGASPSSTTSPTTRTNTNTSVSGTSPTRASPGASGTSGTSGASGASGAPSPTPPAARSRGYVGFSGRGGRPPYTPGRVAFRAVSPPSPPPTGAGGVFSRAFARHNKELAHVLHSLEQLHTQLSEVDVDYDEVESLSEGHKTALYASVALVKQMLSETQTKFYSMMEDNQILGSRIDGNLQVAQSQVTDLRSELADTHRMIDQIAAAAGTGDRLRPSPSQERAGRAGSGTASPSPAAGSPRSEPTASSPERAGSPPVPPDTGDTSDEELTYYDREALQAMDQSRLVEACLLLQSSHQVLRQRGAGLRSQVAGLSGAGDALETQASQLRAKLKASEAEVALTKEALAALKADRKRLKAEKFDLLNQMKQLYQTLEDKERELRDFIRNYELRIKENDESLRTLAAERDETEREKWNILKHARDETERSVGLSAELCNKDGQLKHITEELTGLRKQLSQLGYYSDHDSAKPAPSRSGGATSGNLSDSTASGEAVDGQRCSPSMSPLTLSHAVDLSAMSKSAEQLDSLDQLDRKLRPKPGAKQGTWGSISRVFSRQKQRKQLHMGAHTNDTQWSPLSSLCSSPLTDESYAEKLRLLEEAQQLPMERWKASMVLAWLQVTLGMPQYGPACAENVRSGKVMLELTDVDLERCLGIQQPMHKKKLRLAIEELRQPHLCKYPYISQLNHGWVAAEWLPDIGLAQYAELFSAHLMDGRMLAHLTKKDMERYLNVTRKFHQVSLMHGIQLLRLLQFDRQIICERRQRSELTGNDVLVWTNARFVHWARSIDLAEYADNLKDSGVHGALVVLELSFTADTMATALGVPQSKTMIRRHLAAEMDKLVRPARVLLDEEARYTRWEQERRRHERPSGASSATLGRPFSRSYASGLQRSSDKEKRGSSLRGSLSRAFGLKARPEPQGREPVYETPRGIPATVAVPAAAAAAAGRPAPPPDRPQSVVTASSCETQREKQHRRVKSISDMETLSVTPV